MQSEVYYIVIWIRNTKSRTQKKMVGIKWSGGNQSDLEKYAMRGSHLMFTS